MSPLDLGSELKEHLRPLLGARLLMRPQLFRPHQDQRLVEEFDESTLAIVRAGLLLGLRVGIAAHPPVKHIVDIIGTLAMLSITTTFNDHILLSPQTVTKAASHDGHKNKKNARRVERQGKVVVSPKRKSFQTTQLKTMHRVSLMTIVSHELPPATCSRIRRTTFPRP